MNRFLDRRVSWIYICSLTENFPLLTLIGPCRKAKITEIRSFLTPITAKSNSTILNHGTRENELQTTKKTREFPIYQTHMAFLAVFAVCLFPLYSRRIPRSLASVLKFRYQSLTLKYIEIGLFSTSIRLRTLWLYFVAHTKEVSVC